MTNRTELIVPSELSHYVDDTFLDAHLRWSQARVRTLQVPPLHHEPEEQSAGYGLFIPEGEYDRTDVIVSEFPLANDLGPNMTLRHRFLQMILEKPTLIVAFPHNTRQAPDVYSLTPEENFDVYLGNLDSIVDRQFNALESLGVRRVRFVGDSVGSVIASQFMARTARWQTPQKFDVGPSALFEAVAVKKRDRKEVGQDFRAGGLSAFRDAVNESGIPLYSQIQCTRGGLDSIRMLGMLASFRRNLNIKENVALRGALRFSLLETALDDALRHHFDL